MFDLVLWKNNLIIKIQTVPLKVKVKMKMKIFKT